MLADEAYTELNYPLAGIDTSRAFSEQKPRQVGEDLWARSTPEGVNVRGFEPDTDRARGGSRPGLVKYLPLAPVPGWILQEVNVVVSVQ